MRSLALRLSLPLLCLCLPQARALEPNKIYDLVVPSTVTVEDVDRRASGVILTADGLMLAPYDTVLAEVDLKVIAYVNTGGRFAPMEIKNVKVLKVHEGYRVALLQAKPPANAKFIPATLLPLNLPLTPGSRSFVVGNSENIPGRAVTMGITAGLMSSASRTIEDREFVQLSAAIPSGAIGGPVCDDAGKVFAMAAGRGEGTEAISFAAPMRKLALTEFVALNARALDRETAEEARRALTATNAMADFAEGPEREALLRQQIEIARVWMGAEPAEVRPYNVICKLYRKLGQADRAIKYGEAAARRAPDHPDTCHLLGSLYYEADKGNEANFKRCLEMWLRGASSAEKYFAMFCADDMAGALLEQGNAVGAAYALRWAEVLAAQLETAPAVDRASTWAKLQPLLADKYLENITAKADGFSKAEFTSTASSTVLGVTRRGGSPPQEGGTGPSLTVTPAELAAVRKSAEAEFGAKWRPVSADGLAVELPDEPRLGLLVNAGWQVALHYPASGKIGVLDLASGQLAGAIDCAEPEPLLAAGGRLLTIYAPSTQMLELYDLPKREKLAARKLILPGKVKYVGMGSLNPSHIYVVCHQENQLSYLPMALSVPALRAFPLRAEKDPGAELPIEMVALGDSLEGAMDETGLICAAGRPGISPRGYTVYRLAPGGKVIYNFSDLNGPIRPWFSGGASLVVGTDRIYRLTQPKFVERWTYEGTPGGATPMAIAGYPGFAAYLNSEKSRAFRVHTFPSMALAVDLPLSEPALQKLPKPGLGADPFFFASAAPDRIVCIAPDQRRAILFPLGLKAGATGAEGARPGQRFQKPLNIAAGSKVVIQSGPAGLSYNADKNALVWDIPADFQGGKTVTIILLVTPPGGTPAYVNERILVP